MHELLKRQLERHFDSPEELPSSFVEELGAAFERFDKERHTLELSLEQSLRDLRRTNSEMRAVFKAFPDLFLWVDGDNTIVDVHTGHAADLYLPEQQLLGKRIEDFPVGDVGPRLADAIVQVRSSGELTHLEYSFEKDGRTRCYEARILPVVRDQVLLIVRNITERKRAEEALAAEKEQLAVTLRSIGDGVITASSRGQVVMMNRVAEELTGWSQEEALGQPLEMILQVVDTFSRQEGPSFQHASKDTLNMSGLLIHRDGSERPIYNSMAPMRDRDGQIVGVVIVFRDTTEERRREEERLRATKLESVGILAGGIAHDFNNFLTAILGNIALARTQLRGEPKVADLLERSEIASRQARELTQQLLTFSMGGEPVKEAASASALIEECATFALRGSNVRCDVEIDDDVHLVEIDKGQVSQVIHNLIINADQAMPEGGVIRIRVKNVRLDPFGSLALEAGEYVEISVADRGIGIAPHHLDKIFDPYFTTKSKGSGLGLATSYSIAKNHQGSITVESQLGEGTTFKVYLPAATGEAEVPDESGPVEVAPAGGRVLVMDDDVAVRTVTEEMLKFLGYEVRCAAEGEEMIELYRRAYEDGERFDIVIMDLTIPGGMGGGEAVARVLEVDPGARVIVASGYSNDPILSDYAAHGFRAVLRKPFDVNELSRALDEVRRGEEAPDPARLRDHAAQAPASSTTVGG